MSKNFAKNRKSVYIADKMLEELEAEAKRQDRTISWLLKRAWFESKQKIKEYPSCQ